MARGESPSVAWCIYNATGNQTPPLSLLLHHQWIAFIHVVASCLLHPQASVPPDRRAGDKGKGEMQKDTCHLNLPPFTDFPTSTTQWLVQTYCMFFGGYVGKLSYLGRPNATLENKVREEEEEKRSWQIMNTVYQNIVLSTFFLSVNVFKLFYKPYDLVSNRFRGTNESKVEGPQLTHPQDLLLSLKSNLNDQISFLSLKRLSKPPFSRMFSLITLFKITTSHPTLFLAFIAFPILLLCSTPHFSIF